VRQQIVARRFVAVAVGALILILLILGVRGCLSARKQRGLENYRSDVKSLVASSDQLSEGFFKELEQPGGSGLGLTQAIEADRGTAEGLLSRARSISAPGDLAGAQASLVQTFTLRRDGIAGFATALSSVTQSNISQEGLLAVDHIKELVASDVIYVRAKDQIDQALASESLTPGVPASVFVSDPSTWLNIDQIKGVLGSAGSEGGGSVCPPKSVCGLALASTAIGGAALTAGAPATVTGTSIDVTVENQGDVDEQGVQVSYRLSGSGSPITGNDTIPSLPAGGTKTISIPIKPAPPSGAALTLDVTVATVPGERVDANNKATYSVTFG
jgi:hypothetical protein